MRKLIALLISLLILCILLPFQVGAQDREPEAQITSIVGTMELRSFIQVMNTYLNQTFVLDPRVTGTITVYSNRPIRLKEAEAVFYSILNLYGFTAVKSGAVTSVIPLNEAKGKNIEVTVGSDSERLAEFGDRFITHLMPLTYTKPDALLPLLNPVLSKNGNISADTKTNTLIITDAASNVAKIVKIITQLDRPAPPSQEARHFYKLRNANAQELAAILTTVATQKGRTGKAAPGEAAAEQPQIVADPATNSLVITASAEEYVSLERIIKELDQPPKQVLIEALVAEVSGDLIREFGIQWQFFEPAQDSYRGFGAVGGTIDASTLSAIEAGVPPAGLLAGVVKGKEFPFNIGAILRLYGKNTNFKILSTPQIVTIDNKEAVIKVANTIPYTKQITYAVETSTQIPTQSFDYQDVGITLKITPHINEEGSVRLEIEQEVTKLVSSVTTAGGSTILAPTIAKRSAKSSVIINDRQTMVLGGLIRNDSDEALERVPGFGNIPLLGYFFRHETRQKNQTSLYIFITPTIIASREEADTITKEKKDAYKESEKKR